MKLIEKKNRGLTLIEGLLAMSLMLLIIGALMETSRICRQFFFKLKEEQEFNQEIWAGLDRLRRDLNKAGLGLEPCLASGLILAVESKPTGISIYSREAYFPLKNELLAGSEIVPLYHDNSISRGQLVALIEDNKIELFRAEKVEKDRLFLNRPTQENFSAGSFVLTIEEVFYFHDQSTEILRRRVNSSSSQPLLEKVKDFSWSIDPSGQTEIKLTFKSAKEKTYEITVLPKNAVLARRNLLENSN